MERPDRDAFATRFDTYVSELREVFASRGLRFGQPADVAAVGLELSAPGEVRDDAASVVRSIVYREHEGLSRAELSSIVVVAAGGADLYASAQAGNGVEQLDAFVNGVRLSMREGARVERETETEVAPGGTEPGVVQAKETPLLREEVVADEDADVAEPVVVRAERASVLAGVYSQARMMSSGQDADQGGEEGTYFLSAKADPAIEDDAKGEDEALEGPVVRRYVGWVAGVCVLIVLLVVSFAWRHWPAEREAREAGAEAVRSGEGVPTAPVAGVSGAGPGRAGLQGAPPAAAAPAGPSAVAPRVAEATPGGASSSRPAADVPGTAAGVGSGSATGTGTSPAAVPAPAIGAASAPGSISVPAAPSGATSAPVAAEKAAEPKPAAAEAPKPSSGGVPAAVAGKYVVSSGVMSSNLISAPEPAYPKMAKMWGIEGEVILQAIISSKGKVVAAHVLDGHKMLRASAEKGVKKWRYRPYVVGGKATDVATVVIVNYKLKP